MKFISDKGILHLDLATRNVLLTHPNEIAKISDFGLSKCVDEIDPDEKYGCRGQENKFCIPVLCCAETCAKLVAISYNLGIFLDLEWRQFLIDRCW